MYLCTYCGSIFFLLKQRMLSMYMVKNIFEPHRNSRHIG
jgi:hypothetical protein